MQPTPFKRVELYTRADIDDFVSSSAALVSQLHGQTTRNILEIGHRLLAVKALLGHGEFGSWVTARCNFSARTATRYMSAAKKTDGKSDTVSDISISVVHALSSRNASEAAREAVLAAVKKGTLTSAKEVKAALASVDQPSEAAPVPATQVADRPSRRVAGARKKLAQLIIEASRDSVETALDLAEKAMLPDLQATLVKIKASRAKKQADFKARQFVLPFEPPEQV